MVCRPTRVRSPAGWRRLARMESPRRSTRRPRLILLRSKPWFRSRQPFLLQNKRYEEVRLIVFPVFIHRQIAGDFLARVLARMIREYALTASSRSATERSNRRRSILSPVAHHQVLASMIFSEAAASPTFATIGMIAEHIGLQPARVWVPLLYSRFLRPLCP